MQAVDKSLWIKAFSTGINRAIGNERRLPIGWIYLISL